MEGVNAAVLQDLRILAIERHIGRHQFADGYITVAGHFEIEVARILVFQRQQQIPRLARVAVASSHYQNRVTSWGVLRKRRAIRRIQENGWLILRDKFCRVSKNNNNASKRKFCFYKSDSTSQLSIIIISLEIDIKS